MCSNQLSYRPPGPSRLPALHTRHGLVKDPELAALGPSKPESKAHLEAAKNFDRRCSASLDLVASKGRCRPPKLLRKEVIQPQVPLRLPCYDFTPVTSHSLSACLLAVSVAISGATDSHGVTGGVYKARERIHRSVLICDY